MFSPNKKITEDMTVREIFLIGVKKNVINL